MTTEATTLEVKDLVCRPVNKAVVVSGDGGNGGGVTVHHGDVIFRGSDMHASSSSFCNNRSCDRKFVYRLYMNVRNIINYALGCIDREYDRARRLKSHPHSVIYRIGMPIAPDRMDDEVRAYVDESRQDAKSSLPVRNFVIDRSADIAKRLQDKKSRENIVILDGIVESCLVYQISLRSMLTLRRYLEEHSTRFYEIHTQYDELLKRVNEEGDAARNNVELWTKVSETQDVLDEHKTTIQRLVNQVPFFVSRIREENDFIDLYGGIDDTVAIHSLLRSDFARNEIDRNASVTLKNAYSKVHHSWADFPRDS